MSGADDIWVYHEVQESALCGQHCLNNLLQNAYFTAPDLSDIALDLDASERRLNNSSGFVSGNVDESGNFSVQVLRAALQRSHGLDLVSWSSEAGRDTTDPTTEKGFILNAHDHWFAIRRIDSHWWDLNSTLDRPAYISNFYLSALLSQYREDGYTVFLVAGALPACGSRDGLSGGAGAGGMARWYRESDLLPAAQRKPTAAGGGAAPAPFAGTGHRLGSSAAPGLTPREVIEIMDSGAGDDEDEDLKQALLLSMAEHTEKVAQKSEKEIMREKRLKMLESKSDAK